MHLRIFGSPLTDLQLLHFSKSCAVDSGTRSHAHVFSVDGSSHVDNDRPAARNTRTHINNVDKNPFPDSQLAHGCTNSWRIPSLQGSKTGLRKAYHPEHSQQMCRFSLRQNDLHYFKRAAVTSMQSHIQVLCSPDVSKLSEHEKKMKNKSSTARLVKHSILISLAHVHT